MVNKILNTDNIVINDRRFSFYTIEANQTRIAVTILENDSVEEQYDFNEEDPILIQRTLTIPPNLPEDTEIKYILNRDQNGIIDVKVEWQGRRLQFKAKEIVSDLIKKQIEQTINKMKVKENL